MMKPWHPALKLLLLLVFIVLLCEFLIYYLTILQCSWPDLNLLNSNGNDADNVVRTFYISDPHLLGSRQGHWFDKLRREWQMTRSFQSAMTWLHPDAVFILGDLTDEGKWAKDAEFDATIQRFWKMFYHTSDVEFQVVAGNHDMGFHDFISPSLRKRFEIKLSTPSVKIITIKDIVFVLVNSMAMHTDGCSMCSSATDQLRKASMQLNCTKYGTPDGKTLTSNLAYKCNQLKKLPNVRPILLQHFPLYRESDAMCTGVDAPPPNERYIKHRVGWEVLPKDASRRLLSWIQPRLVLSGHTHHGCYVIHDKNIPEISVPSFSWRNRNNPSIVLVTVSKETFAIDKCFLPQENTVIVIYSIGGLILVLWLVMMCRQYKRTYGTAKTIPHGKVM